MLHENYVVTLMKYAVFKFRECPLCVHIIRLGCYIQVQWRNQCSWVKWQH